VARGTTKRIIDRYHPFSVYVEADISNYNDKAYTFEEYANEWEVDLCQLIYSPVVMMTYRGRGHMLYGQNYTDSLALAQSVHRYLSWVENVQFDFPYANGVRIRPIVDALTGYELYDPWREYDRFYPESSSDQRLKEKEYLEVSCLLSLVMELV